MAELASRVRRTRSSPSVGDVDARRTASPVGLVSRSESATDDVAILAKLTARSAACSSPWVPVRACCQRGRSSQSPLRHGWRSLVGVTGMAIVKVAPRPGPSLNTLRCPWCASTMALLIVKPIPDPCWSRLRAVSLR